MSLDVAIGVIRTDGSGETLSDLGSLADLYDELQSADEEHGDVSVVHDDTGWCLSAHRGGGLVFEQIGRPGARHMFPVSKEQVLAFWRRLVEGDIDGLLAEPWKQGYF